MYDVCVLVCKQEDVRHFDIVKCADLLLEHSILIAERTLTRFGRVVSDEVMDENVHHYKILNKGKGDGYKIERLDAYICKKWVGDSEHKRPLEHKYAIRETTFVDGIERSTLVDSISDNLEEARKALQNRRWYINRELRSNQNLNSTTTERDELMNKVIFNYIDRSDCKFKSVEIQIVETGK